MLDAKDQLMEDVMHVFAEVFFTRLYAGLRSIMPQQTRPVTLEVDIDQIEFNFYLDTPEN